MKSIIFLPKIILWKAGYWDFNQLYPKSTAFAKFTCANMVNPGTFTFTSPVHVGVKNTDYYKEKKVILVNEKSVSHAEFNNKPQTHYYHIRKIK